jgi:signal peptidase I
MSGEVESSSDPRSLIALFRGSPPRRLDVLLSVVGRIVYAVPLWLLLLALLPIAWGWSPSVIASGSMSPAIRTGDVLVSVPHGGEDLGPGTVAVYRHPVRDEMVAHRIISIDEEGRYVTRGDGNPGHDSTTVLPAAVESVGRFVVPFVGLPVLWARNGDWAWLAGFAVALGCAVWLGHRLHWRPRRRILRSGGRQWQRAVAAGAAVLVVGAAAPAFAAFGATTTSAGNSFAAGTWAQTLYLHNTPTPPVGDTVSHAALPLSAAAPTAATLYNYDTDRDSAPGLTILKGGTFGGGDPTKTQLWEIVVDSDFALSGPGSLTVWAAPEDFHTQRRGHIQAQISDCDAAGAGCSTIASASLEVRPWSPTGTWTERTLDFGTLSYTVPAGRMLRLEVVVANNSADMWFAYDTAAHPSRFSSG